MLMVALLFVMTASLSNAAIIGKSSLTAPAVILGTDGGRVTQITLTITTGTGNVVVTGPESVANDTLQSAVTAAEYASKYLSRNFSSYNFNYSINDSYSNVSGPRAGAAMTVLAISAFTNEPPVRNFTMTGTISPDGTIGEIGGVYNKADASKAYGARFMLVPYASNGSFEDSLYVLSQGTFNLPLVEVSNITDAVKYALHGASTKGAEVTYPGPENYTLGSLRPGNQSCTSCNMSIFNRLANFTFNITQSEISSIQRPNLSSAAADLSSTLNSSEQIASKGYLYAGADLAFLDYINAFFFSHNMVNATSGLSLISSIQNKCISIMPPQLTTSNYEYVLSGEVRQGWGNYTISGVIGQYNTTGMENDEVLAAVSVAAEANAWCSASSELYNLSASAGGTYVSISPNLYTIASQRMVSMDSYYKNASVASSYGVSLYFVNAETAFKNGNYPVAIIDADYAIAMHNASSLSQLEPIGKILNISSTIVQNSTFGAWATQFALESKLYSQEALLHSSNSSAMHYYADQAYSSALFAKALSNDTMLIHDNLIQLSGQAAGSEPGQAVSSTQAGQDLAQLQAINNRLYYILLTVAAIFIVNMVILIVVVTAYLNRKPNGNTAEIRKRR